VQNVAKMMIEARRQKRREKKRKYRLRKAARKKQQEAPSGAEITGKQIQLMIINRQLLVLIPDRAPSGQRLSPQRPISLVQRPARLELAEG
jgi:hypothetical protein